MPLIAYTRAQAQWANGNTSHPQAPAHLNWQTVGAKAKAKQTAQGSYHSWAGDSGVAGLKHRPNARKPLVVCANMHHFASMHSRVK